MNTLKKVFSEYFVFSKRDRNGILFLIALLLIMIGIPWFLPSLHQPTSQTDAFEQKSPIVSIEGIRTEEILNKVVLRGGSEGYKPIAQDQVAPIMKPFNPNKLTYDQTIELGLSKKVAKTIQNYLNKGGQFRKATDLKKIYGLKTADYERLLPYVNMPKQQTREKKYSQKKFTSPNKPKSAKPQKASSFVAEQTIVEETKTPQKETFSKPKPNPVPVPIKLQAFNPNELTYDQAIELGLSKKVAKTLQNYLNKGGQFRKATDLKKIYGLNEADFERLLPYVQLPEKVYEPKPKKEFKQPEQAPKMGIVKVIENKIKETVSKKEEVIPPPALFAFNPNTISYEEALELGLKPKVAKTLQNYLNKGGQFRKAADFKKVYGLKKKDFERLAPYIQIPAAKEKKEWIKEAYNVDKSAIKTVEQKSAETGTKDFVGEKELWDQKEYSKEPQEIAVNPTDSVSIGMPKKEETWEIIPSKSKTNNIPIHIDLNQATVEDWEKLRGIGPRIAGRIIKYRDILGGFSSKDQLTEVYGITEELFLAIEGRINQKDQAVNIQKINLNTTTVDELQTHPYIDPKTARKIIRVRRKYGDYTTLRSLKDFEVADVKLIEKITPYLTVK